MDVVDESSANRTYSKPERDSGDEPARANLLASYSRRNFEKDVGNIEDRENFVIIVAFEVEVFRKTGQPRIAWTNTRQVGLIIQMFLENIPMFARSMKQNR